MINKFFRVEDSFYEGAYYVKVVQEEGAPAQIMSTLTAREWAAERHIMGDGATADELLAVAEKVDRYNAKSTT